VATINIIDIIENSLSSEKIKTNYKNLGKLKYFYNGGLKTQSYWAMVQL